MADQPPSVEDPYRGYVFGPPPPPYVDLWRSLVKSPHFWLQVAAVLVASCIQVDLFPAGAPLKMAIALQQVLAFYGYTRAATWQPPRRPWTAAERMAAGLPPEPPPVPPAPAAPELPPPRKS